MKLPELRALDVEQITVRTEEFYSRVTNLGFRVLMAEDGLGWQPMQSYNCTEKPFTDDNCVNAGDQNIDDPVVTPLLGYQVAKGDVLKTRMVHVDLGDVGMLFMPGEPPLRTGNWSAGRFQYSTAGEIQPQPGHYEETNSAGWDLVDDAWAAAKRLFDTGLED